MKILCTICMRAGSKGVKNKNLKLINNKPLMYYTINNAIKSGLFENIVVSTDSNKIINISKKFTTDCWFKRPKYLSRDNSAKITVIIPIIPKSSGVYILVRIGLIAIGIACAIVVPVINVKIFLLNSDFGLNRFNIFSKFYALTF